MGTFPFNLKMEYLKTGKNRIGFFHHRQHSDEFHMVKHQKQEHQVYNCP